MCYNEPYEPDDLEEYNRNEALDYQHELDDDDGLGDGNDEADSYFVADEDDGYAD